MIVENQVILPEGFENNEVAIQIGKYLAMLGPSSGFYSCILYGSQGKSYFLNKDHTFPYVDIDFPMYILMRSRAKTIFTSGMCIRKETDFYGETRGAFGRKLLEKIYEDNKTSPFNLVAYTQTMKDEEIKSMICQKYHKFVTINDLAPVKKNFKEIAERINQLGMGPTLYENGLKTLGKAIQEVSENETNFVEMIMLSLFQGEMPSKFIGQQYPMKVFERDFNKVWESSPVSSTAEHGDGQILPITLKFMVYMRKQKQK